MTTNDKLKPTFLLAKKKKKILFKHPSDVKEGHQ